MRNRLNMFQVRFRTQARLLLFDPESGSKALENYLLTTMTAKMVVKYTTKSLADLIDKRDERRDAHRISGMADSPWERLSRPAHGRRANCRCFPTLLLSEITTISVPFEESVYQTAKAQHGPAVPVVSRRVSAPEDRGGGLGPETGSS